MEFIVAQVDPVTLALVLSSLLGGLGQLGGGKKKKGESGLGGVTEEKEGFESFINPRAIQQQGFAPQSFQGVPTFTGGAVFPRDKSADRIRNIAALINNSIQGFKTGAGLGGSSGGSEFQGPLIDPSTGRSLLGR